MRQEMKFRYTASGNRHVRHLRALLYAAAGVILAVAVFLLIRYMAQTRQTRDLQAVLRQEYSPGPMNTPAPLMALAGNDASASPAAIFPQDVSPAASTEISPGPRASDEPAERGGEQILPGTQSPGVSPGTQAAAPSAEPITWPTVAPNAAMRSEFVSLYGKNHDLAGWLKSDAVADIDYPIVHKDNSYYMTRDFYGRENMAGCVFLDASASIRPRSRNLVLHGHNMKNGTMFGKLHRYLEADFVRANPAFSFATLFESGIYVPFAAAVVSSDPKNANFMAYVQTDFPDAQAFLAYVQELRDHSALAFPVDVREGDRLLTLVTCHGDETHERLIVALREVRPGESKDELAALIRDQLKVKGR